MPHFKCNFAFYAYAMHVHNCILYNFYCILNAIAFFKMQINAFLHMQSTCLCMCSTLYVLCSAYLLHMQLHYMCRWHIVMYNVLYSA